MNDGTKIAVPSNPRLNTPYSHWGTAKPGTTTELAAVAIKSLRWVHRRQLGSGAAGPPCSVRAMRSARGCGVAGAGCDPVQLASRV
jgi:hypothetical protein